MTLVDDHLFGARRTAADVVLYCLPDAGSGASAFRSWQDRVPASIEACPLRLPGRDDRIAESPRLSPAAIAAAIAERDDRRPYALYGHSMGARLAFDVVRHLRRTGGAAQCRTGGAALPVALYVGAAVAPDVRPPLADAVDLSDDDLCTALITRAGADAALRDVPELRELILPVVRADLEWVRSYRYEPGPGLPMPVVAFAGATDRHDGAVQMLGWMRQAGGGFRLYTVPGGHGFHRGDAADLLALLTADLADTVAGRPAARRPPAADEVHVSLTRDGADLTATTGAGTGVGAGFERLDTAVVDGLHPDERAELATRPDPLRSALAFRAAKTALLRAADNGTRVEPGDISFAGQHPDLPWRARVPVGLERLAGWRVTHLPMVDGIGAVAVRREHWRLRFEVLT
jgi:surfactin synthase thioesterase subunit